MSDSITSFDADKYDHMIWFKPFFNGRLALSVGRADGVVWFPSFRLFSHAGFVGLRVGWIRRGAMVAVAL